MAASRGRARGLDVSVPVVSRVGQCGLSQLSAFRDPGHLVACSLLGTISAYDISRDDQGELQATKVWSEVTRSVEKVNAMAVSQSWMVIGGFGKDGKGVVETWRNQQREATQPTV